jgi:DNA topoisomerase-1
VWISTDDKSHLAATGRDAKGRKQYRYHPRFTALRDADKYHHLARFARALPALRRRLKADMRKRGLPRDKVIAAVVALLEETLIRIGNEDYARANGSYGLTTLKNRHVTAKGAELRFTFRGKSGKSWRLSLRDRRVARIVRGCQELPGQQLFEYLDENGMVQKIGSADVNAYLHDFCGPDVTAKDFRTWAGTVQAAGAFAALARQDVLPGKRVVRRVMGEVAGRLGNTIAVCRKCYVHPEVVDRFTRGTLTLVPPRGPRGLDATERAVLALLEKAG